MNPVSNDKEKTKVINLATRVSHAGPATSMVFGIVHSLTSEQRDEMQQEVAAAVADVLKRYGMVVTA